MVMNWWSMSCLVMVRWWLVDAWWLLVDDGWSSGSYHCGGSYGHGSWLLVNHYQPSKNKHNETIELGPWLIHINNYGENLWPLTVVGEMLGPSLSHIFSLQKIISTRSFYHKASSWMMDNAYPLIIKDSIIHHCHQPLQASISSPLLNLIQN